MSKESHEEIIEPDNMRVILIYLDKLNFYIKKIPHVWGAETLSDQKMDKSYFHERKFDNT